MTAMLLRRIMRSQQEMRVLKGTAELNPLRFDENQNANPQRVRGEPDEPPTRLSLTSSSSGENISSKKDDVLDAQETYDSESDDDLEDVHLDMLSKEDMTEVKP